MIVAGGNVGGRKRFTKLQLLANKLMNDEQKERGGETKIGKIL